MANQRSEAVLQRIRLLFSHGTVGGLDDGRLLERFVAGGEEEADVAFEVLVGRHGPMVLRVCHAVLDDPHDAQDAFQATFLVLVRRAHAIRRRDSIASWLFGVARRVALKARTRLARHRFHERRVAAMSHEGEALGVDRHDIDMLHEEIDRLSEKFREPIVLCYLEGMSYERAASHLGVSESTIRGRLARGRERLRSRLTGRGVTVPEGFLVAGLSSEVASATVSPALAASTAWVAGRLASGNAIAANTIAPSVMILTKGALRSMLLTKIKAIGFCAVSLSLVTVGVGTLVGQQQPADNAKAIDAPTASEKPPGRQIDPERVLRSRLVDRARQRVETQRQFYEEGRITLDRFLDALTQLKAAEVLAATSHDQEVAAVKAYLERVIEVEKRERSDLEIGRGTTADVAEASYSREWAELELREQARTNPADLRSLDRRLSAVEAKLDMILRSISPRLPQRAR